MKALSCRVCGMSLYFGNSVCAACGTSLGYSREESDIVAVDGAGTYRDEAGRTWYICRNLNLSGCTWLAPFQGVQCSSCDLTRTRPNDADATGLEHLLRAERAKRYLIVELDRLGFPVVGKHPATGGDPENGLAFDLLSSSAEPVVTGHERGLVTLDLAEGDPVHRERGGVRVGAARPAGVPVRFPGAAHEGLDPAGDRAEHDEPVDGRPRLLPRSSFPRRCSTSWSSWRPCVRQAACSGRAAMAAVRFS